ncbi:hypothetical protein [Escherichia coli]|uniref:hypothetical protein n=3 Tax=Escherichia coli TaxID=562 RepID=UPI0007753481|nr:hypothetical protein [Escherichia coli]EFE3815741.1 hypothetical protein [Escherichia coli]EHK3097146.1 hypothetical protein [Escherichia coli]EHP8176532.1 hypothetical protein [Escherichia coli]EIG1295847.1 hypothetical protein [Escherichia coli]EIQ0387551.1 hypothetical protein [Escherichia coli]
MRSGIFWSGDIQGVKGMWCEKIIYLFVFISGCSFAYEPCRDMQILWQLDGNNVTIPDVTISSGNTASYFDIVLPGLAPRTSAVVSWVQRHNVPVSSPVKILSGKGSKSQATWIAMPVDSNNIRLGNGLKGSIQIISGGYNKRGIYNGYQTYVGVYDNYDWYDRPFPEGEIVPGYRYPLVYNNFQSTKLRVTIERGSALAGIYDLNIPLKIGSEEWYKGEKYCSDGGGVESAVVNMENRYAPVRVNVLASCNIAGNKDISINHNAITSAQARDGHFAKAGLVINCSSPTRVDITIKGSNLISGEGGNVTRCGDNGKCTLTVDGAKEFSGVISGSRTFDITSQYRAIDTNRIDAGSFSGSAIATVLMQ